MLEGSTEVTEVTFADYFRRELPPLAADPDLADWPADVVPAVRAVSQVFNLRPPTKKTAGFKLWIKAGRELSDACQPHAPAEVLIELQRDLSEKLHRGRGYDVCGPQSLVNEARRMAGQMSSRVAFVVALEEDPIEEFQGYECSRCHQIVMNKAILDDDCRHHFQRREDYFAWTERAGGE